MSGLQAAISVRYPLVEAIVAAMFVTQWLVDIGWNPPLDAGFRDALTSYAAHVILLSVCLATTLIDWDERPIPWSLLIWPAMIPLGGVVIGASLSTGGARLGASVVCLIATAILHGEGSLARATPASATTMMIGRWSVWGAILGVNLGLPRSPLALGGATLAWYLARRIRPTAGHSLWSGGSDRRGLAGRFRGVTTKGQDSALSGRLARQCRLDRFHRPRQ